MEARKYARWTILLHKSVAVILLISNIQLSICQDWGTLPTLQMCARAVSYNNNLQLTDRIGDDRHFLTEECVCRVRRKVPSLVRFQNNQFTCSPRETWRLEFYVGGCLEDSYTCDETINPDQQYFIPYTSTASEIFVKMTNLTLNTRGTFYNIGIHADAADTSTSATSIIETECGIVEDRIPTHHSNSEKQDSNPGFLENKEILGAIIGGGVLLLIILIIICTVISLRCKRKSRKGSSEDSQSEYSYARSLPGSVNKDITTAQNNINRQQEKELRKQEKKAERERKKQEKLRIEEAKNHVYDRRIEPITYDNNAYVGTQNSLPDFIPPPPPPPQSNGHATQIAEYAKPQKKTKDKSKKDKKDKKKKKANKREIAVLEGGSVPYGYYDKVVESEFSFMEDEMYGGGGGYY